MKNKKLRILLTAAITLTLAAVLCTWPSFRTAAQTKGKPANKENKQRNTSGSKPATSDSGSKVSAIDQQEIEKQCRKWKNLCNS